MLTQNNTASAWIGALLRGRALDWPRPAPHGLEEEFITVALREGLGPLLDYKLSLSQRCRSYPVHLRHALRVAAQSALLVEKLQREPLVMFLSECQKFGIDTLILKGTHLAHWLYPRPHLRSRCDTDLWIRTDDRDRTETLLEQNGFRRTPATRGSLIRFQSSWRKPTLPGVDLHIDLHWRVSECRPIARLFDFDDELRSSIPIPRLTGGARGLGAGCALLLSCLHRIGHHGHATDWLWIYDVHLLARALESEEWEKLARLAFENKIRRAIGETLWLARDHLGTRLPEAWFSLPAERGGPLNAYLRQDACWVEQIMAELLALPGIRHRGRFLYQHAFPPADFLRAKYGVGASSPVLWLYLRRWVEGFAKLWRPRLGSSA